MPNDPTAQPPARVDPRIDAPARSPARADAIVAAAVDIAAPPPARDDAGVDDDIAARPLARTDADASGDAPAPPPRRRRPSVPAAAVPGLAAAAFGLALLAESVLILSGEWLTPRAWLGWSAAALWVLAAAAYDVVVGARGDDSDASPPHRPDRDTLPDRAARAAVGLRLACAAFGLLAGVAAVALIHAIGDDKPARTYVWVLALWSVAVTVYTLGLGLPGAWLRPRGLAAFARRHRAALLDGAALFGVALVLRLYALDRVPNVLTGDEGVFGLAARWMSQGEGGHMFSTYWANGTLYLVPHAVLAHFLDAGRWATRLPTAIGSAFAAPATYALGRVVGTRRVGLVAGLLVAVAHLHVHVSRMGLGHGLDAVTAAVAGAALIHAVRHNDTRSGAVAGLALGLAQYGYVGGRLVDVVALAFAVVSAAAVLVALRRGGAGRGDTGRGDTGGGDTGRAPTDRTRAGGVPSDSARPGNGAAGRDPAGRWAGVRAWWRAAGAGPLVVAFGGALVVAGPMIRWAIVRPNDYFSRLSAQGILQSARWSEVVEKVGASPLAIAWSQARDAVFALAAAPAHEFYFTPYPMLDVVWTSLLGLGLVGAVVRPTDRGRLWLVLQVGLAWLTLALGAHASTATYRISGALPAIAVLAALALFTLTDALWAADADAEARMDNVDADEAPLAPRAHWATPAGLVAGIVCFQLWAYWGVFAPGCSFFDAGTASASLLGAAVQADGADRAVFVLGRPWFDAGVYESVRYLADRTVEAYDGAAPEHTRADADPALRLARIFDVPETVELDAFVERVRAAAPALIFATHERRSELDFLRERLAGSPVVELGRCAQPEGTLLGVTRIR